MIQHESLIAELSITHREKGNKTAVLEKEFYIAKTISSIDNASFAALKNSVTVKRTRSGTTIHFQFPGEYLLQFTDIAGRTRATIMTKVNQSSCPVPENLKTGMYFVKILKAGMCIDKIRFCLL